MRIGIISDTHGYLDDDLIHNLKMCDEIWHVGDFGKVEILDTLKAIKPLRGVYGNIDGREVRLEFPKQNRFIIEGFDVWMTHIGGYPGRYDITVRDEIRRNPPDIFITGHSHILKILPDKKLNLLHINPGAAGNYGYHKVRTMVMIEIQKQKIIDIKAIELGPRSRKYINNSKS